MTKKGRKTILSEKQIEAMKLDRQSDTDYWTYPKLAEKYRVLKGYVEYHCMPNRKKNQNGYVNKSNKKKK